MPFASLGLSQHTLKAIRSSGYTTPTEIQRKAIPLALEGRDVLGCAPTGTGKTAAFVLPMLERLVLAHETGHRSPAPSGLILTPTRELCQQNEDAIRTYGAHTGVRAVSVYGGMSMVNQLRDLRRGVDIVVATPGRLLDHLQRRSVDLSHVRILVIDEADRMFDMGFINDVRRIISHVPKERQTLLFSATMSSEVKSLVAIVQKHPAMVEVGNINKPVDTVEQLFYAVPQPSKVDLLLHILRSEPVNTMLVFSRTKHGADRIARRLEQRGIKTAAIHSNRSQGQRQQALDGFKRRHYQVLVATDLAARGIDVDGISHVVNFDTPPFAEDYVHRIGRTGRAEARGLALTFVSGEEQKYLRRIEQASGRRVQLLRYPGFNCPEPVLSPAEAVMASATGKHHQRASHVKTLRRWRMRRFGR